MNRISSSRELANKILDFSQLHIERVTKRDNVDADFVERVANLKNFSGLIEGKQIFAERVFDKMLNFHKVDSSMHVKIDSSLIPRAKKVSYFEAIKGNSSAKEGS
jgi:hypothetical protein